MNNCKESPGICFFKDLLRQKFENEMIESIIYKKWLSVDRCTLETIVKTIDEFVEEFVEKLLKLKTHSFIAHMQNKFYDDVKL